MQKKFIGAGITALLIASLLTASNVSYAENKSGNGQGNGQGNRDWNPSSDAKGFWSNSNRNVNNSDDQAALDAESPSIPGLNVVSAEVFKARPVNGALVKAPLGGGDLINKGGALLPAVNVYAIYWGSTSQLTSGYISNTNSFLQGMSCATSPCSISLTNTTTQYFKSNPTISWGGTFPADTSSTPVSNPSTSTIANEVLKVLNKAGVKPDPKGLYLVFTNNYPSRVNYCAWHSAATASISGASYPFTFGYMPNISSVSGCAASFLPGYVSSGTSPNLDSLFNVTTHELYETTTDPMTSGTGWRDSQGYENGDKCSWYWSTPITQTWGSKNYTFTVQQEYSNAVHYCAG